MPGLLDTAKPQPAPEQLPPEEALKPAEQDPGEEFDYDQQLKDIDAGMPDEFKDAWDKLMVAGLRFLTSPKGSDMIDAALDREEDVGDTIGLGAARIILMISTESRGQVPPELFIPGAVALVIHIAKYVNERGEHRVDPVALAKAMEVSVYETLKLNKMDAQGFDQFIDQNAEVKP
jgi:hypothetical protein